jgi:ferritin-like metal-binding protein YciE
MLKDKNPPEDGPTRKQSSATPPKESRPRAAKPRAAAPRSRKSTKAPAVVVTSTSDESLMTLAAVSQSSAELASLHGRIREMSEAAGTALQHLSELRREREAIGDLGSLRQAAAELQGNLDRARHEAMGLRQTVAGTSENAHAYQTQFEAIRDQLQTLHDGLASWRAQSANGIATPSAVASTEAVLPLTPHLIEGLPSPVPAESDAPSPQSEELPEIVIIPAESRAEGARMKLVEYLNEAWAIEKEQVSLLQNLMDASSDTELRAELEAHRSASQRQEHEVAEQVRALGYEPAGNMGLLEKVVTRIWEVLHKPRTTDGSDIEALLKAVSVAELEAGVYRAIYAMARAIEEAEVAEVAARHEREERDFARRLNERITTAAVQAVTR